MFFESDVGGHLVIRREAPDEASGHMRLLELPNGVIPDPRDVGRQKCGVASECKRRVVNIQPVLACFSSISGAPQVVVACNVVLGNQKDGRVDAVLTEDQRPA